MSQPEPRARSVVPVVLAAVVGSLLLVGVLLAPLLLRGHGGPVSVEAADTPISEVETFGLTDRTHTNEDVDYEQSPPAGGPHRPIWLECGVYDEPVSEEHVVHDLEHGTVWLTYDPERVDEDGVATLEAALPDNGILSPYPGLDAPVVATVWDAQLRLTGPEDTGLAAFVREFGDGHTAAEPTVGCHGGVGLGTVPA